MTTFSNGESGSSVRTKLNEVINKVEGAATISNDIKLGDNAKAIFGAGSDLQIYHDGSHARLRETTGDFRIQTTSGGVNALVAKQNAEVEITYAGSTKLATTSTGVDVTGSISADGLTVGTASTVGNVLADINITGSTAASSYINLSRTSADTNSSVLNFGKTKAGGAVASGDFLGALQFSGNDGTDTNTISARIRSQVVSTVSTDTIPTSMFFQTAETSAGAKDRIQIASNGDISFYEDTGTTAKFFWNASAEALGIGTSLPSATLNVVGAGGGNGEFALSRTAGATLFGQAQAALGRFGTSSNHNLQFIANNSGHMTITTAGNVGIGTSSPSQKLHVNSGTTNEVARFESTDGTAYLSIMDSATSNSLQGIGSAGNDLTFYSNAAERMRLDSNGKLLVGTTHDSIYNTSTQSHAGVLIDGVNDNLQIARWQGVPLFLNRMSTDGNIVDFRKDGVAVGSIGVNNSRPYLTNTVNCGIRLANNTLVPTDENGANESAATDLGATDVKWKDLYLSGGVYLGGTGAANHLDDYEEGTWTPTITGSTTNPTGLTFSNQIGEYTKIGRQVTVHFRLQTTAGSGGSGTFVLGGLPFIVASQRSSNTISFSRSITNGGGPLTIHSYNGTTGFNLYKYTDADDFDTAIVISDVTSFASLALHGSLTYYTT